MKIEFVQYRQQPDDSTEIAHEMPIESIVTHGERTRIGEEWQAYGSDWSKLLVRSRTISDVQRVTIEGPGDSAIPGYNWRITFVGSPEEETIPDAELVEGFKDIDRIDW